MTPLPKYASILAILAAVFGALNTVDILTLLPHGLAALVTAGSSILAALSHSLTGTGGAPKTP